LYEGELLGKKKKVQVTGIKNKKRTKKRKRVLVNKLVDKTKT